MMSSMPQTMEVSLPAKALLSSSAAAMASPGLTSSSIDTEKNRESSLSESMLG